jgi:hypothetical protein
MNIETVYVRVSHVKKAVLVSVGLLAIICFSFTILSASALNSNEWSATYSWSAQTYYQGDSGTVTITFYSSCPDQLQISSAGVQFDWATTPITETVNSPNIATGNQYTFNAISFSIPADASVGSHSFTLSIQGQQKGLLGWYSISVTGTGSINVLDAYEKIYNQNFPSVSASLTDAQNSNYQSPDAKSLLQQATNMYNQATSLAQQGQWQAAVNDLNTASNDLSQAQAAEASYTTPTPTNNSILSSGNGFNILLIAILVVVVIIIVIVAIVLATKRSKQAQSKTTPTTSTVST